MRAAARARRAAWLTALLLGCAIPGCVGPGLEPPEGRGAGAPGLPELPGPTGGDAADAGAKGEVPAEGVDDGDADGGRDDAGR